MNTAEKVYEEVRALPEEAAREVLEFVEFLKRRRPNATKEENPLTAFAGVLAQSPSFRGDPVEVQKAMRDEWR